jgi:TM2 domain-containing membrane protein YozV
MLETRAKTTVGMKNPIIASIASFFIPGLGQIYNGEVRKGVGLIIIAIIFVFTWSFLIQEMQLEMGGAILAASGACVLFWIGSMYDAYNKESKLPIYIVTNVKHVTDPHQRFPQSKMELD